MRPRGEIRQALAAAALELYAERGAVPVRALAERALVGYEVARRTADNMARPGGDLVRVGSARAGASGVWVTLFKPAVVQERPAGPDAGADIDRVMRNWAEFR